MYYLHKYYNLNLNFYINIIEIQNLSKNDNNYYCF